MHIVEDVAIMISSLMQYYFEFERRMEDTRRAYWREISAEVAKKKRHIHKKAVRAVRR